MLFCVHLTLFFISGSEVFPLMCTEDILDSSHTASVLYRREVYRILQEEGIDLPRYAVLNRDPDRPEGRCPSSTESHFPRLCYLRQSAENRYWQSPRRGLTHKSVGFFCGQRSQEQNRLMGLEGAVAALGLPHLS